MKYFSIEESFPRLLSPPTPQSSLSPLRPTRSSLRVVSHSVRRWWSMAQDRPLTIAQAHVASGLVASSYVSVLYLIPSARSRPWETDSIGRRRDRLHPQIIRARLWAIGLSTLLSILLLALLLARSRSSTSSHPILPETLALVGLRVTAHRSYLESIQVLIQPVTLTIILFWGPLYNRLLLERDWKPDRSTTGDRWKDLIDIYVLRALIVGPFLEELVFRGCIIAFHSLVSPHERLSKTRLIFLSPLWFGLAHVHGIWEVYLARGGTRKALNSAIIQSAVQFIYTTIFGWYAAFIHLRTGSVIASTLCHSYCNYMGLPPFLESLNRFPNYRTRIIIHHLGGVLMFAYLLGRWARDSTLFPDSILWTTFRETPQAC